MIGHPVNSVLLVGSIGPELYVQNKNTRQILVFYTKDLFSTWTPLGMIHCFEHKYRPCLLILVKRSPCVALRLTKITGRNVDREIMDLSELFALFVFLVSCNCCVALRHE